MSLLCQNSVSTGSPLQPQPDSQDAPGCIECHAEAALPAQHGSVAGRPARLLQHVQQAAPAAVLCR